MLSIIMIPIHAMLMLGVMALTFEHYDNLSDGVIIPEVVHLIVYAGVFGVSVLWGIGSAIAGIVMGAIAGGSLSEGLRMGLTVGSGLSVGRLWPYIGTFAVGAFICEQDIWLVLFAGLVSGICFGINMLVRFMCSN